MYFITCLCAVTFTRECPEFQPLEIRNAYGFVSFTSLESRIVILKSSKKSCRSGGGDWGQKKKSVETRSGQTCLRLVYIHLQCFLVLHTRSHKFYKFIFLTVFSWRTVKFAVANVWSLVLTFIVNTPCSTKVRVRKVINHLEEKGEWKRWPNYWLWIFICLINNKWGGWVYSCKIGKLFIRSHGNWQVIGEINLTKEHNISHS